MASTYKSAGLVVMLMLAALVVSAQADTRDMTVQNDLKTPIKCNGKEVKPGGAIVVKIDVKLLLEVLDKDGKWVPGSCDVPKDVAKVVVFLKVDGITVAVKVVAVLGGLIHQLLRTLLGTILLVLKVKLAI